MQRAKIGPNSLKAKHCVRAPPRGLPAGGLHPTHWTIGASPNCSFLSSSVGSESAPHFNIGPCGRGFELSRRRKKMTIGTCPYSPVSGVEPTCG